MDVRLDAIGIDLAAEAVQLGSGVVAEGKDPATANGDDRGIVSLKNVGGLGLEVLLGPPVVVCDGRDLGLEAIGISLQAETVLHLGSANLAGNANLTRSITLAGSTILATGALAVWAADPRRGTGDNHCGDNLW